MRKKEEDACTYIVGRNVCVCVCVVRALTVRRRRWSERRIVRLYELHSNPFSRAIAAFNDDDDEPKNSHTGNAYEVKSFSPVQSLSARLQYFSGSRTQFPAIRRIDLPHAQKLFQTLYIKTNLGEARSLARPHTSLSLPVRRPKHLLCHGVEGGARALGRIATKGLPEPKSCSQFPRQPAS